jgi:hypothetical protein
VAELRRGIDGGVDRWSVRHGAEVGGGSARRDRARDEATMLGWLREEEGCPPTWVGQLGHTGRLADWADRAKS